MAQAAPGPLAALGHPVPASGVPSAHSSAEQRGFAGAGRAAGADLMGRVSLLGATPTFGTASTQDSSAAALCMQQQPWPQGKVQVANPPLWLRGYSLDDRKSTAANARFLALQPHLLFFELTCRAQNAG